MALLDPEKQKRNLELANAARKLGMAGGGRPRGKKTEIVIQREEAMKQFRVRVAKICNRLFNAQAAKALGQIILFRIDKEKVVGPKGGVTYRNLKPVIVTDEKEIMDYLDGEFCGGKPVNDPTDPNSAYYYITTKEPDNQAIDSMLDRTFGKAVSSDPIPPASPVFINELQIQALIMRHAKSSDK